MIRRVALGVAMLGLGGPALAIDLAPDGAAIARAAAEGRAMYKPSLGYDLADHVVYEVRDARAIDPKDGNVDAVVLATPLERTRHAAYLGQYEQHALAPAEAYRRGGLGAGQIAFIVFAHGSDEADMEFPAKFSTATLTIAGKQLAAVAVDRGGPSFSTYPLSTTGRSRFVATISYRFDLRTVPGAATAQGRLGFTDATGKPFDLPVNLAVYR
jgi:hypothetical protein